MIPVATSYQAGRASVQRVDLKRRQRRLGFAWSTVSFGAVLVGNQLTIYTGDVYYDGRDGSPANVPQKTLTLSASTEWIYVEFPWESFGPDIFSTFTQPSSTPTHFRWPLVKCVAAGGTYQIERRCWWGDIHISSPMV